MCRREIEWCGTGLIYLAEIYLAQDRDRWRALVNKVMNLRDPQNFGKFFSGGFSGRTHLHGGS
jgi:hypothetical protein